MSRHINQPAVTPQPEELPPQEVLLEPSEGIILPHYDVLGVNDVVSMEVEPERFSVGSLKKYLNPIEAAKAYGRFVKRSVRNYGLSEINGTATALSSAYIANKYGHDMWGGWARAGAGAMGENVGFHGTNAFKRYRELRKDPEYRYKRREALRETAGYMLAGFALAEVVDTPVRTFSMWLMPELAKGFSVPIDPTVSVGAGKIAADNVYYGIVDPMVRRYHKHAAARRSVKIANQKIVSES